MRSSRASGQSCIGEYSLGRQVGRRLLDEPGPAADRAERVDDPVVLGEVPGVGALDGHAADRIDQDDVVDDRLERDRLGDGPGDGRGTRRRDEVGAAPPDLDQLGQDRQRDLLGRLGPDVQPGRGPQRGDPLVTDRRLLAQPLADDAGAGRRRDETDVRRVAREREPDGLLVPDPLAGDDDVRRRVRGRGRGCRPSAWTRSAPGKASASAIGSMTVTRQPAAAPSDASAPAIGVVPMTHRSGGGQMRFHVDLQGARRSGRS